MENLISQKIDFIATKYGLKLLMRTHCNTLEEFGKINHFCKSYGLHAFHSSIRIKKIALNYNKKIFSVYISKDKKIAQRFSLKDPEHSKSSDISELKYLSRMLGYPECCIDFFLNLNLKKYGENTKKEILFKKILEKRKFYLLNNFLYGLGYSLSFYQPCSYHCKAALDYNKKILEAIREENPYFATKIEEYLRFPLLIWFDAESDIDDFFHNRIQLLFKGHIQNSVVYYEDVILYRKYPHCNHSFHEGRLKEFFLGDRCRIVNNKIKIFSKNKFLKEIKINNKYHGVLINFI